jgi:hypothetical protein
MPGTDQERAPAGIRRLRRFAMYNFAVVVECIILAATKAWWIAFVALGPAAIVMVWIIGARRVQRRRSP